MTEPTADLLRRAEAYLSALHGSVARHDNMAANLGCAGCELRDQIRGALAEPAAVPPPTDRAALRDRIRQAVCEAEGFGWDTDMLEPDEYGDVADAVLSVLPEPTDQAAADLAAARATNQRLNLRTQRLESELAAYRRAVAQWEITEDGTYVPLRTLATIAKAAGLEVPERWELHYERVERAEADRAAVLEEAPLSPDYEHPECGFHWHGRDGMDIPMRDGQPVCPRCELRRVEKLLNHRERRCTELREESLRRGKIKFEQAEKIRALEREVDEVRRQLGAEILRAGQAEDELRRLAAEAQPATKPDTATLAAALDGLHTLIATSSRDWGTYRVDAWLWAVLCGWDCEQTEHDETCTHGAMEEMQQQHGWSDETVTKARRYRAAVRALTAPAAGVPQDGAQHGTETEPPAKPECAHCWREIENRGTPNMGGPQRDHWVHVPGGFAPCFPQRGADSPRAEPRTVEAPQ